MLTKDDLLVQNTLPHINDVSLKLYKDFSTDILFKRRFHYYFTDGTDIIVEFKEWGIYHMLSIQHIDYNISRNDFFNRIDSGLSFRDFTVNNGIKKRFNNEKERITMFSTIYGSLKYGRVFYIPNRSVPNTRTVKCDYLIYKNISNKGSNLGIKFDKGYFVPFTVLISKASNLTKYIDKTNAKIVSRLVITNINTDEKIENIIYSNDFILHTI